MTTYRGTAAIDESLDKYGSGGLWIKLEPGESVEGAFLGEPIGREIVFNEKTDRTESYDPNNRSQEGFEVQLRIEWNFYDRTKEKVRIAQLTPPTYRRVRQTMDKKGRDRWFTIGREETGGKRARYFCTPEEKIDEATLADLNNLELHDLEKVRDQDDDGSSRRQRRSPQRPSSSASSSQQSLHDGNGSGSSAPPTNGPSASSSVPAPANGTIDPAAAEALKKDLKQIPEADLKSFLAHFGIEKISNLPARRLSDAQMWVNARLQAQNLPQTTAESPKEIDPFAD